MCVCVCVCVCVYDGGQKFMNADQDTLIEYEQMRFIFQHIPALPSIQFFYQCCNAWVR